MAAFRRCILALAVLAVFAGLASAQNQAMTCSLTGTANIMRGESQTEQVGDMLITCTGGGTVTDGTAIPQANITVTMPAAITSRITQAAGGVNVSEALLLIDDPTQSGTAPVTGFGNGAQITVCPGAITTSGCTAFAFHNAAPYSPIMSNSAGAATTGASNTYQGVVNGTQVTFFGVPVLPPATSTFARTFRITNLKMNATALTGLQSASVSFSGTAGNLFLMNPNSVTVGTVQASMNVAAGATSQLVCNPATLSGTSNSISIGGVAGIAVGTVSFTETFGGAFKTRIVPNAAAYSATGPTSAQNLPGTSYASESGLTVPVPNNATAGLADFGTRLKAVFSNIPTGVRVFVSFNNVTNVFSIPGDKNIPGPGTNTTNNTLAQLLTTSAEGTSDGAGGVSGLLATPVVPTGGGVPYVELTVAAGNAQAVWEVVNTIPGANETATFAVFMVYAANAVPVGSVVTVNPSYAPTGTAAAATPLPVPRFIDPNAASPKTLVTFNSCKTSLLFPFLTASNGFETGIAISNTTTDPFGTSAQAGTCTFNFYGTGAPTTAPVSASVASGTTYAQVTSALAPGFTGYMIAVCNFQLAHGFAFLSQAGNGYNGTMGYLPLVLPASRVGELGLDN